ncbi:MAG TPA: M3 family metallopeptidase [Kofleriaceae bacterium]
MERSEDPLLAPWTGAHGGTPPFDRVSSATFEPALAKAMEHTRRELATLASASEAPTFANTILAFEDSGRPLTRAVSIYGVYASTMNDKAMQAVETAAAPRLAAFQDEVMQNERVFARIEAVHAASAKLPPLDARLTDVVYRRFARNGAALNKTDKARLAAINQELAGLFTKFSQNVLADEESQKLEVDGQTVTNTRSSVDPFLTYSHDRAAREQVWKMFVTRGDHAGAHDNNPLISEILALRAERAKLLGFASHAHWITDDNMAKTPEAAMGLMMKVWKAAVARVHEEVADMQKIVDAERGGFAIAPWDYRYYAEKVRAEKYALDQNVVKEYFQLDKMRDAMFWAASQLYGLTFTQIADVPVYHPDVTVYEVTRGAQRIGLWYFDPYARDGKRSGAWMSEYRTQETFKGELTPIVSNNANFVKGKPGEPVLISWDDARTLFHEFGHALHGLSSHVEYPTLAGTNVLRDFVEFPSQLNEHWFTTPELLERFALHYQTGKPIPAELVRKIENAKHFNSGFNTVEYLAAAIYDMKIHMAASVANPAQFEQDTMREIGMPAEIVMRHRPTQFLHIFSGDEYSAGYYSYIWADTLTADAAEAFSEAGSFYDKTTAKKLHDAIMSAGNSLAPEVAFREFRGRDVDTNALMRDRGFPVT